MRLIFVRRWCSYDIRLLEVELERVIFILVLIRNKDLKIGVDGYMLINSTYSIANIAMPFIAGWLGDAIGRRYFKIK